jgi:hypothetical protein
MVAAMSRLVSPERVGARGEMRGKDDLVTKLEDPSRRTSLSVDRP